MLNSFRITTQSGSMNKIKTRGVYMQNELKVVVVNPPTEEEKQALKKQVIEYLESIYRSK